MRERIRNGCVRLAEWERGCSGMSWRLESRALGTEDRRASVQDTWGRGRHEQNAAGMGRGGGNEMEEVACFSLTSRKKTH